MIEWHQKLSLRDWRRRFTNLACLTGLWVISVAAVVPFASIVFYICQAGWSSLDLDFFTSLPKPIGESGGGMANAMLGSATVVSLAALLGVPWGIGAGIYLSEYGHGKIAQILRFSTDLLASVPSIVVGLFAYALFVVPFGGFSAYAGAAALAVIIVPVVAKTTEEILRLMPQHMREAGLALGLPRWKVILRIVVPGSAGGIITGIMLAVARVAGETAPLLFTAFNNQYWSFELDQPTATLPVQIYTYAISPFEEWQGQAWAGSFVLIVFVFMINFLARVVFRRS